MSETERFNSINNNICNLTIKLIYTGFSEVLPININDTVGEVTTMLTTKAIDDMGIEQPLILPAGLPAGENTDDISYFAGEDTIFKDLLASIGVPQNYNNITMYVKPECPYITQYLEEYTPNPNINNKERVRQLHDNLRNNNTLSSYIPAPPQSVIDSDTDYSSDDSGFGNGYSTYMAEPAPEPDPGPMIAPPPPPAPMAAHTLPPAPMAAPAHESASEPAPELATEEFTGNCIICYEHRSLKNRHECILPHNVHHGICSECFRTWRNQNSAPSLCPMCRQPEGNAVRLPRTDFRQPSVILETLPTNMTTERHNQESRHNYSDEMLTSGETSSESGTLSVAGSGYIEETEYTRSMSGNNSINNNNDIITFYTSRNPNIQIIGNSIQINNVDPNTISLLETHITSLNNLEAPFAYNNSRITITDTINRLVQRLFSVRENIINIITNQNNVAH